MVYINDYAEYILDMDIVLSPAEEAYLAEMVEMEDFIDLEELKEELGI